MGSKPKFVALPIMLLLLVFTTRGQSAGGAPAAAGGASPAAGGAGGVFDVTTYGAKPNSDLTQVISIYN